MQAKFMSPAEFWRMHGGCAPLLRPVAVCMLSLNHAAGVVNGTGVPMTSFTASAQTLSQEVYYYSNSKMLDARRCRGKLVKSKLYFDADGNQIEYPKWGDKQADSGSESVSE